MKRSPYELGFYLLFGVVLISFFTVIQPYLLLFLLAFCTAVTIMPLQQWLVRYLKNAGAAAVLTALIFLLGILAPLGFFAVVAIDQAATLATSIQNTILSQPEQLAAWQQYLERTIPLSMVQDSMRVLAQASFEFIKGAAVPFAGSVVSLVINLVFFLLILIIFLVQKNELVEATKKALPLAPVDAEHIVDAIVSTIGPIMRSTVIVAFIQALLGVFILAVFGVPSLVFFFFALFLSSFIPLGSGLIMVPIAIVQLLLGNIVAGVSMLLWHTFITSSSDNVIRSQLFRGGTTKLPELLTLIATLGGLAVFGILGVVFGPLLAVVFIVFYRLYLEKKEMWREG